MKFKKGRNIDAEDLTELTIESKSHWSYSSAQTEEWLDELTITEEYFDVAEVYKLFEYDKLIGYYSYFELNDKKVILDNLFLASNFIGKGYGKVMMEHFFKQIKGKGYDCIELDSEPKAEKFYHNFGFRVIGHIESSIKNRYLPIMQLKIKPQ